MDIRAAIRWAAIAAVAVWVGAAVQAQAIKGFGFTVIGVDGKPLVGANATLVDLSLEKNTYTGVTDKNGEYLRTNIPYSEKGFKFIVEAYGGNIYRIVRPGDPDLKSDDTGEKKIMLTSMNYIKLDLRKCTTFRGIAKEKDGSLLTNAKITAVNLDDETKSFETKTGGKGEYRIEDIPFSGKGYRLTLSRDGKEPFIQGIQIESVGPLTVDLDISQAQAQAVQAEVKPTPAMEARDFYSAQDYEGAISKADEALKTEDADTKKAVLFIKGKSLDALGRNGDALAVFEEYIKFDPQNKDVAGVMMRLAEAAGNKAKAAEYEKLFIVLGGKIEGQNFNKGAAAFNSGNFPEAIKYFDLALKDDPNDFEAMKQLGVCYGATQQFRKAIPLLETYLKSNQDSAAEAVLTYCKSQVK